MKKIWTKRQRVIRGVLLAMFAPIWVYAGGLELYYDFEDVRAGSSIQDLAGNNLFASLSSSRQTELPPVGTDNVPATLSSRSQGALDTQGGFLWVRNGVLLDLDGDVSISFWFKSDGFKNQRSTFITSLQGWRFLYNRTKKQVVFQTLGENSQSFSFEVDLGGNMDWSMLTLVKEGDALSLYLNAEKKGTIAFDSSFPPGGGFYIGSASTAGRYAFDGLLDDFGIWSSAITAGQIKTLYQGTSPMENVQGGRLQRMVTTSFPSGFQAYVPPKEIILSSGGVPNAVIVAGDRPGIEKKIQQVLFDAWGIEFPIMSWSDAKGLDKNLILFGAVNASEPLRRLGANFLLGNNHLGYELRAIPYALDWGKGVLYIGGKNEDEVLEGAHRLLVRCKDPEKIPYFIECKGWDKRPSQNELDAMVAEIEEKYSRFGDMKNQDVLKKIIKKPVVLYRMTGFDEYAVTFAKMLKIFAANYDHGKGGRKLVPTFTFHYFPQYIYNMEHSPAFTAEDRLRAAEIIRKAAEEALDYWEMVAAQKLYQLSKQSYLQNHECFASRTVESAARYLISRYDYDPAKYWKAVADNAFAGVAPHPFSPEDAAGYQYLVYRIFVDYAMASGEYDSEFLKTAVFKEYVDSYLKPMFNHLGYTAGYGDAPPTGMRGGWALLKQAVDILGDEEAEYILDMIRKSDPDGFFGTMIDEWDIRTNLPAPGAYSLGLNLVELKPFKQKRYQLWGLYKRPALDKAIFRSGWDMHSDFMAITGINGGPHGHFDANGISQYISGDRLWLIEGDYIKKFPYDHNSIVVCRDGQVAKQRKNLDLRGKSRASQILASTQTADKKLGLLSLLLEDYNGVNWTRNICYAAKNGFWVLDDLQVKEPGHYNIQCYWRSVGQFSLQPQAVGFVQKPSDDPAIAHHFFITEGSGAKRTMHSEFDACHGRKNGVLAGYKFAGRSTRYLIQRRDGDYQKDGMARFVNFLQAAPGRAPTAPVIHQISPDVYLAEGEGIRSLAVIGAFSVPGLQVDAEICFINTNGLVARGAKSIELGGLEWGSAVGTNVALEVDAKEVAALFDTLKMKGSIVVAPEPSADSVPDLSPSRQLKLASAVTGIAGCENRLAVGELSGLFSVYNPAGEKLFEHQFPKAISAVSSVKWDSKTYWAVAVQPENPSPGDASIHFLDDTGSVLWKKTIEAFHLRNGTVPTLFTAQLHGAAHPPALIAGSEGWHAYAFSLEGEELWRESVYHAATVGAAGDMTGDGMEDIAMGCEYYYHSLIDSKGATNAKKTTSPYDYSVAVCDMDSDGIEEAIFGRGDGYLYVMTPPENKYRNWSLNVGGKPISLVEIPSAESALSNAVPTSVRLAAATDTGQITFIGPRGKKTGGTELPAPITDMKWWKGNLLATALDGYAYVVGMDGTVQFKIKFQHDINTVHPAQITVFGDTATVSSGTHVYLINTEGAGDSL